MRNENMIETQTPQCVQTSVMVSAGYKTETIEQAAERMFPHHKGLTILASNKIMLRRSAFVKGAKWQQEKSTQNIINYEKKI